MAEAIGGIVGILTMPSHFMWLIVGAIIGLVFAALPGINGVMAVALFAPFTYYLGATDAMLALIGIYQGSNFGGCITAVLFNIPGDPAAVCTMLDGHPMAKRGEASKAIGAGLVASSIGGLLSAILMCLAAPALAKVALRFGASAVFGFVLLGFATLSSTGEDMLRSLISLAIGVCLATVGISPATGVPRFTFGIGYLTGGVDFVVVLMGLFAVGEVLGRLSKGTMEYYGILSQAQSTRAELPSLADVLRWLKLIIPRSAAIGTLIGLIPGVGATMAAVISYSVTKQTSKYPERFGKGEIEGVVAPEAANNASAGGAMTTLLALGIPGSATTAIILGALLIAGINPGPRIFVERPDLVGTIFGSMLLVNFLVFFLGLVLARMALYILRIPGYLIDSLILVLSFIGIFGLRNNVADVFIAFAFGVLAYALSLLGVPTAPLVLGVILGPIAEKYFVTALQASNVGLLVFLHDGVFLLFFTAGVLIFCYPFIAKWRKLRKGVEA